MIQQLEKIYQEKLKIEIFKKYNYKNIHQIPKIEKIVINRGIGDGAQNAKLLESFINEVSLISGQKSVTTRSKKAIAAFKLRKNMPVGVMVTLRGDFMYSFLDRLINIVLPRIRDFKGIDSKSFDGRGNLNIGLKEQLMFPEIKYNNVQQIRGMDISIITTTKKDNMAKALLEAFGMPFKH